MRRAEDNPDWQRLQELKAEAEKAEQSGNFDPGETIAVFERGDEERLRLARKTFNGRAYVDLRVEFRRRGTHAWTPTRKGVTVKSRELARLADALAKLAQEAER